MPTRGFQVCHGYQNKDSKDALVWSIWRDDPKKKVNMLSKRCWVATSILNGHSTWLFAGTAIDSAGVT